MIKKVKDRLKNKLKEKKGSGAIMTIAVAIFVLGLGLFIADYLRIFTLQENISDELYRASNLAIKYSMYDSHRQSAENIYNENICREAFYDYLYDDMGLTHSLEKYKENGDLQFYLTDLDVDMDGTGTRLEVSAMVHTRPEYFPDLFTFDFPVEVKSRNMRTVFYD